MPSSNFPRGPTIIAIVVAVGALVGAGVVLRLPSTSAPGPLASREADGTASGSRLRLVDVTVGAGIEFVHESGARGEKLNPETFGPGGGWLDHDGDGLQDILLVNGNTLRGEMDATATSRLYRNRGDGSFEDVTERAGIDLALYGMGFVAADVDADGDQDVFLYGLRRSLLLENDGEGRFLDVTRERGLVGIDGWVCAAAFFDADLDGDLDLFVGNYVDWRPEIEEAADCTFGTATKKYCPVALFAATAPQLFRNRGDGTFEDVSADAGLSGLRGKALGVVVEDFDRDGDPDVLVANDSVPNFLLVNDGDASFEDRGVASGFATDADGAALAGMGIDAAWREDGRLIVAIGNFSDEPTTVHVQEGGEFFVERSFVLGVGRPTLDSVTFGALLRDFDLDGHTDLVIANGHVFDVEALNRVPYRQRAQVFLGAPSGAFREHDATGGDGLWGRPRLGRALSAADYDGDGDLDLLLTENQGSARLFRNETVGEAADAPRWVRVVPRGGGGNRDAIGAEITLVTSLAGDARRRRETVRAASSYLGSHDRAPLWALVEGEAPVALEVRWPTGGVERFERVAVGEATVVVEGRGERAEPGRGSGGAGPSARPPGAASAIADRERGARALRAGRFAEALPLLERATREDPRDFVARRLWLVALSRTADREALESAIASTAERFEAALLVSRFGLVLREQGETELAYRLLLEAQRRDPERPDIPIYLGAIAYDARRWSEAQEHYERALALRPDAVDALDNLGKIHAVGKRWPEAVGLLERALALRPNDASVLSTLGGIFVQTGELDRAEDCLRTARRHARSTEVEINVHGNLGGLWIRRRDRARALEAFRRVLELSPGDAQARRAIDWIEAGGLR